MRYLVGFSFLLSVLVLGCGETTCPEGAGGSGGDPLTEAEAAAIEMLEVHMQARNERDSEGLAAANNYPHVRLGGGHVFIWETPEEFALFQDNIVFPILDGAGWARSEWDAIDVIQSSPNKVHLAVEFSRFDAEETRYLTAQSFWIVTKQGDHWGIQGRSSFVDEAQ